MSALSAFTVGPTRLPPIDGIKRVDPSYVTNLANCEMNLNIGIFFDGTGNNRDADTQQLKHSNIARLWQTYVDREDRGYFRIYIPGVGTEFPEVRERGESMAGSAFGEGGEPRVLYALLAILNAIHQAACSGEALISKPQISALCCTGWNPPDERDLGELAKLGESSGLYMTGNADRNKTLQSLATSLKRRLSKAKPRVKECFVDVFGFSRGATQARVFCNWLNLLLDGEASLAGVKMTFRFLGIMDTVASVGVIASAKGTGHGDWALVADLRILASVRYCVHMVAMHELRKNFPLDSVTVDGIMRPNCREFAYPGAHSDVGGGYLPGALGVSVGRDLAESDSLKLSQIPLNHMLECALKAGVPLVKRLSTDAEESNYDAFAIAPALQAAYDEFLDLATLEPRPLKEWLQPYLNWRWYHRDQYSRLQHVRKSSEKDRGLLFAHNQYFLADATKFEPPTIFSRFNKSTRESGGDHETTVETKKAEKEARKILQIARSASPEECLKFHVIFDGFVHDSLAGFNKRLLESGGHWRYREGFLGSDEKRTVSNDNSRKTAISA